MKTVSCPKNSWTTIIGNFGTGYPKTFYLTIAADAGQPVTGQFREQRYFWIIPETPTEGHLQPQMQFHRYWINGIYSVKIKPDVDCTVTFGKQPGLR